MHPTNKNSSSRDRIWTADFTLCWIAFKGSTVSAKHRPSDFNKPWAERTARSGTGCSTKERKTLADYQKFFLLIFKHGNSLFNLSEQVKVLHLCSGLILWLCILIVCVMFFKTYCANVLCCVQWLHLCLLLLIATFLTATLSLYMGIATLSALSYEFLFDCLYMGISIRFF